MRPAAVCLHPAKDSETNDRIPSAISALPPNDPFLEGSRSLSIRALSSHGGRGCPPRQWDRLRDGVVSRWDYCSTVGGAHFPFHVGRQSVQVGKLRGSTPVS